MQSVLRLLCAANDPRTSWCEGLNSPEGEESQWQNCHVESMRNRLPGESLAVVGFELLVATRNSRPPSKGTTTITGRTTHWGASLKPVHGDLLFCLRPHSRIAALLPNPCHHKGRCRNLRTVKLRSLGLVEQV